MSIKQIIEDISEAQSAINSEGWDRTKEGEDAYQALQDALYSLEELARKKGEKVV